MYHYVRDLPNTPYPRIKGMLSSSFGAQVDRLVSRYEMVDFAKAVAYLKAEYRTGRELCLLTFDDGLMDHYDTVVPMLVERNLSGVFGLISDCTDGNRVASVHKIHYLMATLEGEEFAKQLAKRSRAMGLPKLGEVEQSTASAAYQYDTPVDALMKYYLNYVVSVDEKERLVSGLFAAHFGKDEEFAKELYLDWGKAREMQDAGMTIAPHGKTHANLGNLSVEEQRIEIAESMSAVETNIGSNSSTRSFVFPYGDHGAFSDKTVQVANEVGIEWCFTTLPIQNTPEGDSRLIGRIDTNEVE